MEPPETPKVIYVRSNLEKICAWCRKVQLPDGTWRLGRRATDATVPTHGICPDCAKRDDIAT
jgi:hypothetical protein